MSDHNLLPVTPFEAASAGSNTPQQDVQVPPAPLTEEDRSVAQSNYLSPEEFSAMPQRARQRMRDLARENAALVRARDNGQPAPQSKPNGRAPAENGNGNGADKWSGVNDEQLDNYVELAERTLLLAAGQPDNKELLAEAAKIDRDLLRHAKREQVRRVTAPEFASRDKRAAERDKLGSLKGNILGELQRKYTASMLTPDSPLVRRASLLEQERLAALSQLGIEVSPEVEAATVLWAYEAADAEIKGAEQPRRVASPSSNLGSAQGRMQSASGVQAEIAALRSQGRTTEANRLGLANHFAERAAEMAARYGGARSE